MVEFINRLEEADCSEILNSSLFSCLKALVNE